MRPIIFVLTAFIFTSLVAEDYAIKLERTVKAGYSYTIDATGTTNQAVEVSQGQEVLQAQEEQTSLKLKGTVTVDAVNDKGAMTTFTIVIDTATQGQEGSEKPQDILPKGTKVTVDYTGEEPAILTEGKVATKEVHAAIDMFFSEPDDTIDDEMFGTQERKKVKDTWEMNKALAAKKFGEMGMQVPLDSLKGMVTLEDVKKVGDIPCLLITAEVSSDKLVPPVPGGLTTLESTLTSKMSGHFPVDTSLDKCSEASDIAFVYRGKGKAAPDAPEVTMAIKMTLKREATYTPVK